MDRVFLGVLAIMSEIFHVLTKRDQRGNLSVEWELEGVAGWFGALDPINIFKWPGTDTRTLKGIKAVLPILL